MWFRNVEEMSDRELLMELVREKRRLQVYRYVKLVVFVIALVVFSYYAKIYVPQIIAYFKQIKENVDYLNNTLTEIRARLDAFEQGTDNGIQAIRDLLDKLRPSSWFNGG